MKLHKRLTINGEPVPIVNDDTRLNLFNAGRALFTVQSGAQLSGVARLSCGFDPAALVPFFTGYIEYSSQVDDKQQRVFCREFAGALNQRLPLALRHCSLVQLLELLADKTKLPLRAADADYSSRKAGVVYSCGMGFQLMDSLGGVFGIDQYIWQQQRDGSIFVGSWQDSLHAERSLDIPKKFIKSGMAGQHGEVPALPRLRPGAFINGQYITGVRLRKAAMQLTWHPNPWRLREVA